eukprot:242205_1
MLQCRLMFRFKHINRINTLVQQKKWKSNKKFNENETLTKNDSADPFKSSNAYANKYYKSKVDERLEHEKLTRKLHGFANNAISPVSGPAESKHIRRKIGTYNSSSKIIELLNKNVNLDVSVYNMAIKRCGLLTDTASCKQIMQLMKEKK